VRWFQHHGLGALEVENQVGAVAIDGLATEGGEPGDVVEFLDRRVQEAAVIRHRGGDGVNAPLVRQLVVQGEVQGRGLEVE
jgi:hypothetical protein